MTEHLPAIDPSMELVAWPERDAADRSGPDGLLFLRNWLADPVTIGAVMPTRAPLARAMAGEAAARPGGIVELGGGTGPVTRALVAAAGDPGRILVVERNPIFHALLARRFPTVRVVLGQAEALDRIVPAHFAGPVGTVVSSVPRVGWPLARQQAILEACFALLGAHGRFLEFSYGPFSPVPRRLIQAMGLRAERVRRVFWNLPPATLWAYSRPA